MTYTYDADGNQISAVDADGHGSYDGYFPGGLLCYQSSGAAGGTCDNPPASATIYTYDSDARLATIKHTTLTSDQVSRTTTLCTLGDGELQTVTNPIGTWSYGLANYSATSSSTVQETAPTTDTVTRTFDAMGRLSSVSYGISHNAQIDRADDVAYAYNDAGNLCNAVAGADTTDCSPTANGVSFTYDGANRIATSQSAPRVARTPSATPTLMVERDSTSLNGLIPTGEHLLRVQQRSPTVRDQHERDLAELFKWRHHLRVLVEYTTGDYHGVVQRRQE